MPRGDILPGQMRLKYSYILIYMVHNAPNHPFFHKALPSQGGKVYPLFSLRTHVRNFFDLLLW